MAEEESSPGKPSPLGQIIAALVLILLCAGWLLFGPFWGGLVCRALLALGLILGIVFVLWYTGIFTGHYPKDDDPKTEPWKKNVNNKVLALFILVYAMLFTLFSVDVIGILWVWILVMTLFVIFLATIGDFVVGRPLGLIIDSRNRVSLSTLQTILWTVVLLSAFFTVATAFIQAGKGTYAFNIALDPRLWALMGISVTTLAGTPLIKDVKSMRVVSLNALKEYAVKNVVSIRRRVNAQKGRFPDTKNKTDLEYLKWLVGGDSNKPGARHASEQQIREILSLELDGPLWKAETPDDASALDLFKGDEGVNQQRVDLGKVQMFFFTVIGALSYMLVLGSWIATLTPDAIAALPLIGTASCTAVNATAEATSCVAGVEFPVLSEGFIAILGISHAGFLGKTAVNKMPGA